MISAATARKVMQTAATALLMLLSFQTMAKAPVYTSFFSDVAVSGYDAVAYFTENKPHKGSSAFITEYNGAQWHFKSAANLAAFKASPEKYAPQYGGYCAWAVANNDTASGDPEQWTIHGGKLYLNYDAGIQAKWLKDKVNLIEKGDSNWPRVIQ